MLCFKSVALVGALLISVKSHDSTLSDSKVSALQIKTTNKTIESHLTPDFGVSGTFSIVAIDPETGECGAAVASKYPDVGRVVAYARAGAGAFCTQHWHNPKWGEQALDLLEDGMLPEEVISKLIRDDERRDMRQLGIIDIHGRTANHNPTDADGGSLYWGSMSGRFYACQGNTLTGREVILAMSLAYEETQGSVADRLMAALVAGDAAGGDHRGRLAAGIRIAKPGIEGYSLDLHIEKSEDAVKELAQKYASLKESHETERAENITSRPFRMGFTGFPHDITIEAVMEMRVFLEANSDILAHHIEGVPWAESLKNLPLQDSMLEEWNGKKAATPPGAKVYLSISPGRGDLKVAEKGLPLPDGLRGKAYHHPMVKQAYLAYCRRALKFFKPDYLGIGIEVNEIVNSGAATWAAYVELHKHVYHELKKEHPELPIFASFTLHSMLKGGASMFTKFTEIMPYNDFVAVSYYPFLAPSSVDDALKWLSGHFDRFQKPYAIVETNEAAERLRLPQSGIVISGDPGKQRLYYEKLLALAQGREFEFVISFIHRDYDLLWEKIKEGAPELFMAWRDCGLMDQDGNPRPALNVWGDYFSKPLDNR